MGGPQVRVGTGGAESACLWASGHLVHISATHRDVEGGRMGRQCAEWGHVGFGPLLAVTSGALPNISEPD